MKATWRLFCLAALVWLAMTSVQADDTTPVATKSAAEIDQMIIDEVKDHQEIMNNLTYISDVIGPRMTGSANLRKANDWTMEKFKSYGIENVRLEPYTIPAGLGTRLCPNVRWSNPILADGWLLPPVPGTPGTQGN